MDTSQALRRCGDRIECWDDDPDFADLDLKLTRTPSSSPQSPKSNMRSNFDNHNRDRRESISSRMSVQSSIYDFDSPDGWDHERQVLLDDSPAAAIASAINAGIPIPENVPSSALIGGTIKRLGTTKKAKRIAAHDDWGEDLELPMSGMALKVRGQERHEFPDSLQQILSGSRSRGSSPMRGSLVPVLTASSQLNKFRELPGDDDFFADSDDLPILKVSPVRHTLRQQRSTASLLMTPPLSESATRGSPSVDDDFENDFEFPADAPLQLNIKLVDNPRGLVVHGLDSDFEEWVEGNSLGTRFGGTGRERGLSVGAMSIASPSVSSVTAESEDEAPLDGLELPAGPLPDFREILEKRKQTSFSMDTEMIDAPPPAPRLKTSKEDFLEGIEIGDGEVFDTRKLTLNRNVKHKQPTRKTSPVRRSAMSLTFTTNKASTNTLSSGIGGTGNRLRHGHPTLAPPIPILEPVVERERENQNPPVSKRPELRNRWSSSVGNTDRWSAKSEAIPANIPPPPPVPHSRFADRQRQMGGKQSLRTLKTSNQQENTVPTTTNAQLLRMKRSMPNIGRAAASPSKNNTVRSPSRNSGGRPASRSSAGRPPSSAGGRPPSSAGGRSTTTATGRNEPGRSKTSGGGKPAPFLPAGGTVRQSHHIAAKISQQTFEYKEKIAAERRTNSRHQQRTPHHSPSSSIASVKTKRGTPTIAPEPLRRQAAAIETLKQPTRKRNFGDGTELETFDDLPTSAKAENRFVVTPVGRGAPKAVKSQSVPIIRGTSGRDGESPMKKIDLSRDLSSRFAEVPRFARDTNASRNAREQRMGISNTGTGYTGTNQWKQQVAARGNASPKSRRKPQLKPQLIKPMGNISNPPKAATAVNGMTYNAKTFRWEGNENEIRGFEAEKNPTPPRPALISNVNHSGSKLGIQVVGGMVFDPASMSWLKVDEDPEEDDHDPFEGFDDLMDHDMLSIDGYSGGGADSGIGPIFGGGSAGGSRSGRLSGGFGEFVVGEEFDVGPEFVRRQREEEDRWRQKVHGWISTSEATKTENKWAIRELLSENL